jgi:hypothetical protein
MGDCWGSPVGKLHRCVDVVERLTGTLANSDCRGGARVMTAEVVSERNILSVVQPLVSAAANRVWVTAPWVTTAAADLFFGNLVARLRNGEQVDVRVVYRLKGADDLSISDLDALDRLGAAGVKVRYSNRLHAKLVIIDATDVVVSSSNLTLTAGYSATSGDWQNEELGIHLTGDRRAITVLTSEFETIWAAAHSVSERTVGITLDQTSSDSVRVACVRPPIVGEFVAVGIPARTVGTVQSVSSYKPTVPAEAGETDVILGLRGGGGGRRSQVPDIETLFSHPSKTHAFLMSETFVRPAATYHIAEVSVLRSIAPGGSFAPSLTAVEPGEVVTEANPAVLDQLISGLATNRIEVGHLPPNPSVRVTFDLDRLLTLHSALLGMTGTGKSNAVKVIVDRALAAQPDLAAVIIDTHGEYAIPGRAATQLTVRFEPCLQDEAWVKRAARAGRQLNDVMEEIDAAIDDLGQAASLSDIADALEAAAGNNALGTRLKRLATVIRATPNLCIDPESATVIEIQPPSGQPLRPVDWSRPGLYILNLLPVGSAPERIRHTGAVAFSLLHHAKHTSGTHPALLVVDEAQNYAPEQQTGRLGGARPSFEPVFEIATEGRKFRLGLLIASQRPARVNKDVLSQCNTQLIFRMVSVEDLGAVRESFESASDELLRSLPTYPTGTCYAAGAALAMGVQVTLPLI